MFCQMQINNVFKWQFFFFTELTEKCTFSFILDQLVCNFLLLSTPAICCRTFQDIAFYAFPPPPWFNFIFFYQQEQHSLLHIQSINQSISLEFPSFHQDLFCTCSCSLVYEISASVTVKHPNNMLMAGDVCAGINQSIPFCFFVR